MITLTLLTFLKNEKNNCFNLWGKKNSEKKYSQPLDNQEPTYVNKIIVMDIQMIFQIV